jgi:hypothetical protein
MRQMKKVAVTTTTIALALSLSSCYGSGPSAETRMISRVTDGAEAVVKDEDSDIRISNFLLVATEDGSAVVVGHIVNRSEVADELLGVSVGGVPAALTGETKLATNKPLHFEGELANVKAVFPGVSAVVGTHVDVTIGFARAGLITVKAIIREKRDYYANITSGAKLSTTEEAPAAE